MQLLSNLHSLMRPSKRNYSHVDHDEDTNVSWPRKRHIVELPVPKTGDSLDPVREQQGSAAINNETSSTEDPSNMSVNDIEMEETPSISLPLARDLEPIDIPADPVTQNDSSDDEEVETHDIEHNHDGSSLVKVNINGVSLPMERRAGETKLRIPSFVLRPTQPADEAHAQKLQLAPSAPPMSSNMGRNEPYEHQQIGMDVDTPVPQEISYTPSSITMDID